MIPGTTRPLRAPGWEKKGVLLLAFLLLAHLGLALDERQRIHLSGEWNFTREDVSPHSNPSLDTANWSTLAVPGDWEDQGIKRGGCGWYQRNFIIDDLGPMIPRYLRFDRIMDEGEAWLNGLRLKNPDPALCDLLRYRQFGSFGYKTSKEAAYYHNYPLEWPYMFPITDAIRPGTNELVVRVLDDLGTPEAGIVGDVYLVLTGPCYISDVKLIPPKEVSPDKEANFTFDVAITNDGEPFEGTLELLVLDTNSQEQPGGDHAHLTLRRGSEKRVNLTWTFHPKFEKYVARVVLSNDTAAIDVVEKPFHGTVVEVREEKFYVNGERFLFKGLNFAGPRDFDVMKWIGLNGIRIDHPDPHDVDLGLEEGIVYAPLVGLDSCRSITDTYDRPDSPYNQMEMQLQVLAMRDNPNVIIWNVANEMSPPSCEGCPDGHNETIMEAYLKTRFLAAHSLDPYDRPVSYSNIFWQHYSFWQDIIGTNVYGRNPDIPPTKPLFMTEWGMGLAFLRNSWNHVVLDDKWGVMGAALWPGAGHSPSSGDIGINDYDPAVRDEFRWGLRDFLQDLVIDVTNSSDEMTIGLANRRFYRMNNLVVQIDCLDTGRHLTRRVDRIDPYRKVNLTISGKEPVVIQVNYTTHGGLKAYSNLSTLTNPDHTYPRILGGIASYFRYGMSFRTDLSETCRWNVSVVAPTGEILEFLSGVGDSISMTWNATAKIKTLAKGEYRILLSLEDLAGNRRPTMVRYRYPLREAKPFVLLLASVIFGLATRLHPTSKWEERRRPGTRSGASGLSSSLREGRP